MKFLKLATVTTQLKTIYMIWKYEYEKAVHEAYEHMVDYVGKKSCKLAKVIDMWVFDSPLKKLMLLFNLLLQKSSSKECQTTSTKSI